MSEFHLAPSHGSGVYPAHSGCVHFRQLGRAGHRDHIIAGYSQRITLEMHAMSDALSATQMALSREQKLTDLGGVVAAAAHEAGHTLATIKLASAELMEELADQPELYEDAALIRERSRQMSRYFAGHGGERERTICTCAKRP